MNKTARNMVVAVAALALAFGAGGMVGAEDPPERNPAQVTVEPQERSVPDRLARPFTEARGAKNIVPNKVHCRTVQCFNRAATRLAKALNFFWNCTDSIWPQTQFGDYEQYPNMGPITGLDITGAGGTPSYQVVAWICGLQ